MRKTNLDRFFVHKERYTKLTQVTKNKINKFINVQTNSCQAIVAIAHYFLPCKIVTVYGAYKKMVNV